MLFLSLFFLTLICLAAVHPAYAADDTSYTWTDDNGNALDEGLTVDGNTITLSSSGTLTLTSDITANITIGSLSSKADNSDDITVTIDLNGYTLTGTGSTSVITVGNYLTAYLNDSSSNASGVVTHGGGNGSIVSGYRYGGGICVGTGSTFTMNGGTVTDNDYGTGKIARGGGVYVYNSTFILNGGTISNNEATGAGGGIYVYQGYFYMNGGTVENNAGNGTDNNTCGGGIQLGESDGSSGVTAVITGGTVTGNYAHKHGGGIYVCNSTLTMTGGTISGNKAYYTSVKGAGGGLWINKGSTFTFEGGTISGNSAYAGGGVAVGNDNMVDGSNVDNAGGNTFIMTGGTISGNYAEMYGANMAVGVSGKKENEDIASVTGVNRFEISGGIISDNASETSQTTYGGGVFVSGGSTLDMTGGTITNCSASYGGGICAGDTYTSTKGVVNITGGNVVNCSATEGAGIYAIKSSEITMSGGAVTENNASNTAGGAYLGSNSSLNATGGILANNLAAAAASDVYAYSDCSISLLNMNSDTEYQSTDVLINGWFIDVSSDRYSVPDNITDEAVSTATGEEYFLIAAYNTTYTVTYTDGAGGSAFADESYTGLAGTAIDEFSGTPEREGYTFLGWSTDGQTVIDLTGLLYTENITYIAVWESAEKEATPQDDPDGGNDETTTQNDPDNEDDETTTQDDPDDEDNETTTQDDPNDKDDETTTSAKTDDSSNMLIWVLFLAAVAAGTAARMRKTIL